MLICHNGIYGHKLNVYGKNSGSVSLAVSFMKWINQISLTIFPVITEPSQQENFLSRANYGLPFKNQLSIEIRFDNIGLLIVEEKNKTRRC